MPKTRTSKQHWGVSNIIAIDPGISGAVACFERDLDDRKWKLNRVFSMPVELKKSGRRQVHASMLHQLIDEFVDLSIGEIRGIVERVSAMPGQGVSGMFSLGDSFGVARALCGAMSTTGDPMLVSPVVWKKAMGLLKKKKSASLTLARRLYPAARPFLHRKKDEGRAEAILIGHYALKILKW